jgi:predicted nucleotidyltransferase
VLGGGFMRDNSTINEITKKVYNAAKQSLGDKLDRVILYGSRARGDNTDDSDVDIIVIANIPAEDSWNARMQISRLTSELDLDYNVLVSLHVTDCATFNKFSNALPFYMNVIKEGVLLSA